MKAALQRVITGFPAPFGRPFGISTAPSPGDPSGGRVRQNIAILAVVLAGLAVRMIFYSGEGLGDDTNQFLAFKNIYDGTIINSPYYHRFSYWLPQIILWKLFGISEFTFILPVLLSSLACIYVVYLITRELYGVSTAFIAAALMAVNPFEVLNATLISTDVNLSLYMLLSVYFFILAQRSYGKAFFFLSALFVFLAFVNKPFGLFILPVLALFYFRTEGITVAPVLRYLPFLGGLSAIFSLFFVVCRVLTGDPLIYFNIYREGREPFHLFKMDLHQILVYPKLMFFKHEYGERLHGYHFFLVALAFLLLRRRNLPQIFPVMSWFLLLFALINFMPHKIIDFTPYTAGRIFRYFVFVVPPSIIFVAYFWDELKRSSPVLFPIGFAGYLIVSVYGCSLSTMESRIAFGETRSAIQYMRGLPKADIYSDGYFISKIQRLESGHNFDKARLHPWVYVETPEAWQEKFRSVQEGYVVTGGPRLPYYGCYVCIPNLGDFIVPERWSLIREFSADLYPPWKVEPLRIWRVSREGPAPQPDSGKAETNPPKTVLSVKPLTEAESAKLYETGMQYFDRNDCKTAQSYYEKIVSGGSGTEHGIDALYFHSICFFRLENWRAAIGHFRLLVDRYPKSNWAAGSHFHMGYSYKQLGDYENAKKEFKYVIRHFPDDKSQTAASREQLKLLPGYSEDGFFRNLFR